MTARLRPPLLLALLVLGCPGPAEDECDRAGDPVAREDCLFERVSQLFSAGDHEWRQALQAIDTPASRDLVRLRLAILDPQQGPTLCREVETEGARQRCRRVVGRPHLASPPRPPGQEQP